ncbi:hypothetical protein SC09_Contig24orf00859 [Bacillus subtilis]|uniref:YqeB PH domain-containing protein n=1 Tax=Bacillus subtilis TaxID=1423 RepID=A0A0D1L7K9_BACIU|nr:hypothetical protein SC09_Contig24orf00859 [Bacillus subtilis]
MQNQSHTLIGVTKTAVFFLYAALAIIGFAIGYFIPQIAKWALSLPWIPLEGPLRLITSFQGSTASFITALLGMCAGIWFAHSVIAMLLSVKITEWNSSKEKKCKQFIPMTSLLYLWITNGLSSWEQPDMNWYGKKLMKNQ